MAFTEEIEVEGYNTFQEKIKEWESDPVKHPHPLFILFTGSNDSSGKSWCPDCVEFEKMWSKMKGSFTPDQGSFIRVKVGERNAWKDAACPFRTDKTTSLKSIPTLVKWGTAKKLAGNALQSPENVKMLMEED